MKICRVSVNEDTRQGIMELFDNAAVDLVSNGDGTPKEARPFFADYKTDPEDNEYIEIEEFELPSEIIEAIDDPLGLDMYEPSDSILPQIRALFVGVKDSTGYHVAFQRFRSAQYLWKLNIHLFYSGDTLVSDNERPWARHKDKVGLTITPTVDCVYDSGRLRFVSAFYAKQILDLTEYYHIAERSELNDFVGKACWKIEDQGFTVDAMDSWERRKVGSILNARILEEHPVDVIAGLAGQIGLELDVSDGKIVFPADKQKRRQLLAFLDEDIYRGAFSDAVFRTNSKRPANG